MAIAAYDPATYSSLPTIRDANEIFVSQNALSALPDLGKVFVAHAVQSVYGLALLHRHFELSSAEYLVEYRGTTTPWPLDAKIPGRGAIVPTSWDVSSGEAKPYEFEFVPKCGGYTAGDASPPEDFVRALADLLARAGLGRTLGLAKLSGGDMKDPFEATIGRTSFVFPADGLEGVPAMWQFDKGNDGAVLVRVCSQCSSNGSC